MSKLSRDQIEAIIHKGESVMIDGKIISKISDLPSEAALAGNDPAKIKAAKDSLQSEAKRIADEVAKLDAAEADIARIVAEKKADAAEKAKVVPAKP